jgi:hypothetical protein
MSLARQVRLFLSLPPARRRFQPEQVQQFLRGEVPEADGAAPEIRRMVERLPAILREPGIRRRYEGFQRYFDVLPRIIFLYHRGVPASQIATDLSFLATDVGVEMVLQITSEVVAERLNRAA